MDWPNFINNFTDWFLGHAEGWESVITRWWVHSTFLSLLLSTIILGFKMPKTRMQRASFFLVASFTSVIGRTLYLGFSGNDQLPQPFALFFWSAQMAASGYFLYALFREWVLHPLAIAWIRARSHFMKRTLVILLIVVAGALLTIGVASAQDAPNPCEGLLAEGQVGLNWEGNCITPEPERGPVQGIVVKWSEDINGNYCIQGIIVFQMIDNWAIVKTPFEDCGPEYEDAELEDGFHIEMDD